MPLGDSFDDLRSLCPKASASGHPPVLLCGLWYPGKLVNVLKPAYRVDQMACSEAPELSPDLNPSELMAGDGSELLAKPKRLQRREINII